MCNQKHYYDTYVRDKHLATHPLVNPLRIRLADGIMIMARFGIDIEFNIGALKINQEFIVTRLSGQHQIILSYEFLKDFNPQIEILRFSDIWKWCKPLYPNELLMLNIYPANKWHDC